MSGNVERSTAVAEAMADIRAIDAAGIDRDAVELIRGGAAMRAFPPCAARRAIAALGEGA